MQTKPPEQDWNIWRIHLSNTFGINMRTRSLCCPLGPWINPPTTWQWWFLPNKEHLYFRENEQWFFCPRVTGRQTHKSHTHFNLTSRQTSTPPSDLHQAMVTECGHHFLQLTGFAPCQPESNTKEYDTFQEFLHDVPASQWCWPVIEGWGAVEVLVQALSKGSAVAVTDGSFKDSLGTAAWVLQSSLTSNAPRL